MVFRAYNPDGPDLMIHGDTIRQAVEESFTTLCTQNGITVCPDTAELFYDPDAFGGPGGAVLRLTVNGKRYDQEIYVFAVDLPYPITLEPSQLFQK